MIFWFSNDFWWRVAKRSTERNFTSFCIFPKLFFYNIFQKLIVGFGKALELAKKELDNDTNHVTKLFNQLFSAIKALFPNI